MTNESWAEVRANGRAMRYRRPPVIVLCKRLGVVMPELTDPAALGPFIEGLGTKGLTVLAAGEFYEAALALATQDPERVAWVSPIATG